MRILHLVTRSEPGGAQTVIAALAEGARAEGHAVAVASGPEGRGEAWARLDPAIERIEVSSLRRALSPGADLRALGQIAALFRSWKPDIVHLHTSKAAALGRLAPGLPAGRILYTMHGYDQLRVSNGKMLGFDKALRRRCGAIVAVSRRDLRAMWRDGYSPRLIPNGVAERPPAPPPGDAAAEAMTSARRSGLGVALAIAREARPKRIDLLRAAAALLDGAVALFWIGGDPRPEDPPNFRALGALPDAASYLPLADLFALASDHEGMPVSVLEAFSAGIPAVASDVGGIPELLGDPIPCPGGRPVGGARRATRGCAARNEPDAFAGAIADLWSDGAYRAAAGAAARAAWGGEYSAGLMVERYCALYADLLGGRT